MTTDLRIPALTGYSVLAALSFDDPPERSRRRDSMQRASAGATSRREPPWLREL